MNPSLPKLHFMSTQVLQKKLFYSEIIPIICLRNFAIHEADICFNVYFLYNFFKFSIKNYNKENEPKQYLKQKIDFKNHLRYLIRDLYHLERTALDL